MRTKYNHFIGKHNTQDISLVPRPGARKMGMGKSRVSPSPFFQVPGYEANKTCATDRYASYTKKVLDWLHHILNSIIKVCLTCKAGLQSSAQPIEILFLARCYVVAKVYRVLYM